jgi:hypothetical protein
MNMKAPVVRGYLLVEFDNTTAADCVSLETLPVYQGSPLRICHGGDKGKTEKRTL